MDQHKYREQHYKRTEETIKLNSLVLRSLLGLLVVVLIGTGTAIVTATNSNRGALIILGLFVSLVLLVAAVTLYITIRRDISKF